MVNQQFLDAVIGIGIMIFIALIVWSNYQNKSIKEVLLDIKEAIKELKE